jgi:hypothetical protein
VHYWIGFKLLCAEVLIASRLGSQLVKVRLVSTPLAVWQTGSSSLRTRLTRRIHTRPTSARKAADHAAPHATSLSSARVGCGAAM